VCRLELVLDKGTNRMVVLPFLTDTAADNPAKKPR
jgi:hypothetical protein